jgi:hypothetical protein
MSSPAALPNLDVVDFGPGQPHVVVPFLHGQVLAIMHGSDPALQVLPRLQLAAGDPWTYVFVHGGADVTRFENLVLGTHEIPVSVIAALLTQHYGSQLPRLQIRMCYPLTGP